MFGRILVPLGGFQSKTTQATYKPPRSTYRSPPFFMAGGVRVGLGGSECGCKGLTPATKAINNGGSDDGGGDVGGDIDHIGSR